MKKEKIRFVIENILFAIIAAGLGYIFSVFLLCFSFFVHESGHVLFGFIDNILHLKFAIPYFSNYVNCTVIPVPQQTLNISDSLLFAFGGSIFSLLFFFLIAYEFSKKFRKYSTFFYLVAFTFFIREVFGNMIFGTDNHMHGQLLQASVYPILSSLTGYMLYVRAFIISTLIILILREKFPYKKIIKN